MWTAATHSLVASVPPTNVNVVAHARLLPYKVTIAIDALQCLSVQHHQALSNQYSMVLILVLASAPLGITMSIFAAL